jgi:hypothetical protein
LKCPCFVLQVQETVERIRSKQIDLFEEHLNLESHPGDGIDMLGSLDSNSADEDIGENHFKPLETWFNSKEKSIQVLSGYLEEMCQQMTSLNDLSSKWSDEKNEMNVSWINSADS